MVLVFLGATMFWLKIPLAGTVVLSSDLTPLITALWVIGITNAINLIDGLDGLAAGIVAIASGALAVYGLRLVELGVLQTTNLGPLIAVITCGVCLGFLPHNFNPGKGVHGRCRCAVPRPVDGCGHDGDRRPDRGSERADLLLLRSAVPPAVHPRRPDRRHGLRLHPAGGEGHRRSTPPTTTTCTTGSCGSATGRAGRS